MLLDAAEYARRAVPEDELDIETHLCTDSPSLELVDRSKSASMVVVGAGAGDNRFGWERFGSVSRAVVTRPVVVGVDGSEHSVRGVRRVRGGLAARHRRGGSPRVVRPRCARSVPIPDRVGQRGEQRSGHCCPRVSPGTARSSPTCGCTRWWCWTSPPTIWHRTLPMRSCSFSAVVVEAGSRT